MNRTLVETVRLREGVAPLWYLHLRRLAASCRAIGVPLPGELLTPEGGPDRVHRLEVSRRGLQVSERPVTNQTGVRLAISPVPHEGYPHKTTTDRRPFERTLADARARGADDGILLTEGGFVAEAAIWTLFWWEEGRICAPPLALGILPSVARARVAEVAGGVEERRIVPSDLRGRPLLAGNAVRGLVPVTSLDGADVPEWPGLEGLSERFWA
jgi:branched-subunit amino acid aminotransferase/4-amino-4-deoxychorismate lyase